MRRRAANTVFGGLALLCPVIALSKVYHIPDMSRRDTQMTVTRPDIATSLLWALNAKDRVGRRVSRAMEEAGYDSDEALAQAAGVTVKTVWRLRHGKSYPRADTAERIAAALQIS